jgi:hypothetical protein
VVGITEDVVAAAVVDADALVTGTVFGALLEQPARSTALAAAVKKCRAFIDISLPPARDHRPVAKRQPLCKSPR